MGQSDLNYLQSLAQWKGQGGFNLDAMRKVMGFLGNPQDKLRLVHVGGTNGKGSVCAAISAICGAGGLKVGLTISPNLIKLNERIVVDGLQITDEELSNCISSIRIASEASGVTLSYFEATIACAFLHFVNEKVDLAVLEVGLGGRLDATNIVSRPEVSVLVSVQRDHEDILGSWPDCIAREKVEIFKVGSKVVVGDLDPVSLSIVKEKCDSLACRLYHSRQDFFARSDQAGLIYYSSQVGESFLAHQSLEGQHQVGNMAVAIATAQLLGNSVEQCQRGLRSVYWPCRLESVVVGNKTVIFDCAHNLDGMLALCSYLEARGLRGLKWCFGAISTKDWKAMLSLALPYVDEFVLLDPLAPNPVDSRVVSDYLSSIGVKNVVRGDDYQSIVKEIESSRKQNVVVAGSMYMVGHVRSYLPESERPIWTRTVKDSDLK